MHPSPPAHIGSRMCLNKNLFYEKHVRIMKRFHNTKSDTVAWKPVDDYSQSDGKVTAVDVGDIKHLRHTTINSQIQLFNSIKK